MGMSAQCTLVVSTATIAQILQTESKVFEWAINVTGLGRKIVPTSREQAVALARHYNGKGHSVDLGLGQINSRNMKALGLTWDNVFDPCTNIAAAGAVRSEEHTSELQSLMRNSYAVLCLKKKKIII